MKTLFNTKLFKNKSGLKKEKKRKILFSCFEFEGIIC